MSKKKEGLADGGSQGCTGDIVHSIRLARGGMGRAV